MKEYILGKIIRFSNNVHSWAHKQRYNKDQKFCSCASKHLKFKEKFDEKDPRLQQLQLYLQHIKQSSSKSKGYRIFRSNISEKKQKKNNLLYIKQG